MSTCHCCQFIPQHTGLGTGAHVCTWAGCVCVDRGGIRERSWAITQWPWQGGCGAERQQVLARVVGKNQVCGKLPALAPAEHNLLSFEAGDAPGLHRKPPVFLSLALNETPPGQHINRDLCTTSKINIRGERIKGLWRAAQGRRQACLSSPAPGRGGRAALWGGMQSGTLCQAARVVWRPEHHAAGKES